MEIDRAHMGNNELVRAGVSLDILFRLSDVSRVPDQKFFEFRE